MKILLFLFFTVWCAESTETVEETSKPEVTEKPEVPKEPEIDDDREREDSIEHVEGIDELRSMINGYNFYFSSLKIKIVLCISPILSYSLQVLIAN